jgi:hypothetical protein
MTQLFENFLKDEEQYDAAEKLWQQRWTDLVRHRGQEKIWHSPWINACFADGSKTRDGNPIFSAICPSRRLAVRIVQVEPSARQAFRLWTDIFAKGEPEETTVLTIVCVLSDDTIPDVIDALSQWILNGEVARQMSSN